mgnify:CR=1 FL=1
MTFMEALEQDLQDTFFNLDEFGATHTVDGTSMTAIVDEMENIEREKKMKSNMDGIHARQIILYVKASAFGPLPAQGRIITLDSRKYTTLEAVDEGGVYSITLEANRSR